MGVQSDFREGGHDQDHDLGPPLLQCKLKLSRLNYFIIPMIFVCLFLISGDVVHLVQSPDYVLVGFTQSQSNKDEVSHQVSQIHKNTTRSQ